MTSNTSKTQWQYLEQRPDSWRKQLFFKGRRLRPSTVWSTMLVEEMTPEEAAYNWDLSLDEVTEAIAYCEANRDVLKQDAEAERRYLEERGIDLEPFDCSLMKTLKLNFWSICSEKPVTML